jgi:hypothetical protein
LSCSFFQRHPDSRLRVRLIKGRNLPPESIAGFSVGLGALDAALAAPSLARLRNDQSHFAAVMGNVAVVAINGCRHG